MLQIEENMNRRQIFAVIMVIVGVGMIIFSNYIADQVTEGKLRIARGEKQIKQTETLFSLNPVSKEVGKTLLSPGEKEIAQGKVEVSEYERVVSYLRIGGAVLMVLGFIVLFTGKSKKR